MGAWTTLYSRPSRPSFTAASARLDVAAELSVLNVGDHWLYAVTIVFENKLTHYHSTFQHLIVAGQDFQEQDLLSQCLSDL